MATKDLGPRRGRALFELAVAGLLLSAGAVALVLSITVPMTLGEQLAFGLGVFVLANILHRFDGSQRTTFAIAVLSIAVTSRYIYWRLTETLHFDNLFAAL